MPKWYLPNKSNIARVLHSSIRAAWQPLCKCSHSFELSIRNDTMSSVNCEHCFDDRFNYSALGRQCFPFQAIKSRARAIIRHPSEMTFDSKHAAHDWRGANRANLSGKQKDFKHKIAVHRPGIYLKCHFHIHTATALV